MTDVAYQRMRSAIRALDADLSEQGADTSDGVVIQKGTHLRDVLLRSFNPVQDAASHPWTSYEGAFAKDQRIQSWVKRHSLPKPIHIEGDPELRGMNATQIRAIAAMLGERFSLVQGPPGTGKTRTIVEALRLLKVHFSVPHPLLVCTYTNVAVDHLVEGLAAAGLRPLRFGAVQRVPPALLPHTLEHQLQAHPSQSRYKTAVEERDKTENKVKAHAAAIRQHAFNDKKREAHERVKAIAERRLIALNKKVYAIYQGMVRDILDQADVVCVSDKLNGARANYVSQVCTTCVSAASITLNAMDFPVVFLDEASMSTEPASLIPLMKGAQHVALIGDHKQLPPVITSQEAQSGGFGVSLFERLIEEGVVPSVMLDTQYRMHPSLARFPSGEFYNDLLLDGVADAGGDVPARLAPPASRLLPAGLAPSDKSGRPSVVFLDHGGNESRSDRSRVNWNEAHIVCSIIEDLLIHNEVRCLFPFHAPFSDTDTLHSNCPEKTLASSRRTQRKCRFSDDFSRGMLAMPSGSGPHSATPGRRKRRLWRSAPSMDSRVGRRRS
jgi:superfamily I DNA and/or RNA helicase